MSYSGLGLSILGQNIDTAPIAKEIVGQIGPPAVAYLKGQIPGIMTSVAAQMPSILNQIQPQLKQAANQVAPILQAEAANIIATLPENPYVKKMKRDLLIALGIHAAIILGGMYVIEKYAGRS